MKHSAEYRSVSGIQCKAGGFPGVRPAAVRPGPRVRARQATLLIGSRPLRPIRTPPNKSLKPPTETPSIMCTKPSVLPANQNLQCFSLSKRHDLLSSQNIFFLSSFVYAAAFDTFSVRSVRLDFVIIFLARSRLFESNLSCIMGTEPTIVHKTSYSGAKRQNCVTLAQCYFFSRDRRWLEQ